LRELARIILEILIYLSIHSGRSATQHRTRDRRSVGFGSSLGSGIRVTPFVRPA
jgi:hypothetical protein